MQYKPKDLVRYELNPKTLMDNSIQQIIVCPECGTKLIDCPETHSDDYVCSCPECGIFLQNGKRLTSKDAFALLDL